MLDLHREKTLSVTQEYSRRHKKATLQSETRLVVTQGRLHLGFGRPLDPCSQSASTSRNLSLPPSRSNLGHISGLACSEGCGGP